MTNINPINVNTQGIHGALGFGAKPKSEKKETEEAKPEVAAQKQPLTADEVLNYLAKSALVAAPKRLDTAKFVDAASEERIASFMADFEDKVAEGLAAFSKEFPAASPRAGEAVVLAKLNKEA